VVGCKLESTFYDQLFLVVFMRTYVEGVMFEGSQQASLRMTLNLGRLA
jgi:hypothetical protein